MGSLINKTVRIGKRSVALLIALVMVFTSFTVTTINSNAATKVNVKKITITKPTKNTLNLKVGKTYQLKTSVKVSPNKKANKKVSYKSSNKEVATVSSSGVIKARSEGASKITVTSNKSKKKKASIMVKVADKNNEVTVVTTPTATVQPTAAPTTAPTAAPTTAPTTAPTSEPTAEPIVEPTTEPTAAPIITFSDVIPSDYLAIKKEEDGSIEHISYKTKAYFGDSSEITKNAYVYLPYNYDATKQYNVLYLMHGIGGNEKEWGMYQDSSRVKIMLDNLIYKGEIEPYIVVVPNGRSCAAFTDTSFSNRDSFYKFGQELRNDLIPYIDSTYATYADYNVDGYDLSAARDHRAMAGLSMGGMQTINIGMCESLDMISYFGAFSAAPTSYTASKISTVLKDKYPDYDINYFYNMCGTEDGTAFSSSSAASNNLTSLTDKLTDGENFKWQTVKGVHDFNVWYLGFYNYAKLVFKK